MAKHRKGSASGAAFKLGVGSLADVGGMATYRRARRILDQSAAAASAKTGRTTMVSDLARPPEATRRKTR